jgi:hypothetical protein
MGEKRNAYRILVGKPEDQNVGWWTILKWILGGDGVVWIDIAQDRDQWWALLNAVMNLRFP